MVIEMKIGSSGATSFAAAMAALLLSVSKIVSIRRKSAPPSRSPRTASAYPSRSSSNVISRNDGSSTLGDSESVTLVGPTDPATNRLSNLSASARAISAPRRFIS